MSITCNWKLNAQKCTHTLHQNNGARKAKQTSLKFALINMMSRPSPNSLPSNENLRAATCVRARLKLAVLSRNAKSATQGVRYLHRVNYKYLSNNLQQQPRWTNHVTKQSGGIQTLQHNVKNDNGSPWWNWTAQKVATFVDIISQRAGHQKKTTTKKLKYKQLTCLTYYQPATTWICDKVWWTSISITEKVKRWHAGGAQESWWWCNCVIATIFRYSTHQGYDNNN